MFYIQYVILKTFDLNLTVRLDGDNYTVHSPDHVFYLQDDDDEPSDNSAYIPPDAEYGDMLQHDTLEADDIEFESLDKYVGAEFFVNDNGKSVPAKVLKRARDNDGNAIGKQHSNPLMDTRAYDCELGDGTVYRYTANVIAENIFAQCDDEGRRLAILQEITDHRRDNTALHIIDG